MEISKQLEKLGQSLWYDNIERRKLEDGSIQTMIEQGQIKGITSNPSIFEKAIALSKDYDVTLKPLAWSGISSEEIFWQLAVEDITAAARLFAQVYQLTNKKDGYVSLEVSPLLASDTDGTLNDAKKLWNRVNQPNLMIKIPATREGIPAIRKAIAAGINVNVTLIFSIDRYAEVIDAYISGLEDRVTQGLDVTNIHSVASFFISRMDTKIDAKLEELSALGRISKEDQARLSGKVAVANARMAYQLYTDNISSERFQALKIKGANVQRPLWASTSTKNPKYRDVVYIEELIAPDTVNTVPPATLQAFLDHGQAEITICNDLDGSAKLFKDLESIGISIAQVTNELEIEGVKAFSDAYQSLLGSVEKRRISAQVELGDLSNQIINQINDLVVENFPERFFAKDATLWTSDPGGQEEIRNRMNWISTPYQAREELQELDHLAADYLSKGFTHAVLLGMGGSSLAPEVISRIYGHSGGNRAPGLNLLVLDSTDPDQVAEIELIAPVKSTVYVVASKSGTTGEINAFLDYFWQKVKAINPQSPGDQFIAITDPGTRLAKLGEERSFSRIFLADPQVGGRNSALTSFGLVPAALLGVNLDEFSKRAVTMADWCSSKNVKANPGITLGAILGAAARAGKDKVTLITGDNWSDFGDWLEQLVAESSGKEGKGLLPVANEPILPNDRYSHDRIFVRLEENEENQSLVEDLLATGHPVISIHVNGAQDLAAQFYLWEIAIATACAVIGVNSFDQPDVQDAKIRTIAGLEEYRKSGKFAEFDVFAEYPGVKVISDLPPTVERRGSLLHLIFSAIEQNAKQTEFVAINAFLPRNKGNEDFLQAIRLQIGEKYSIPTTVGFGPRYLHSTGQFHKGGPNTGLFLLITAQRKDDIAIPGQGVDFGVFQRAQAIGDLQALKAKGRNVIWLDLAEPDLMFFKK